MVSSSHPYHLPFVILAFTSRSTVSAIRKGWCRDTNGLSKSASMAVARVVLPDGFATVVPLTRSSRMKRKL